MVNLRVLYQFSMGFQRLYPYGIFRRIPSSKEGKADAKVAYLTFDDGPIPEVTPQVLKILEYYHVKATFFMVGDNIVKYPDLCRQVAEAGHTIGNHTFHHVKGMRLSTRKYLEETKMCEQAIQANIPEAYIQAYKSSNAFRPPYGRTWFWQRRRLSKMGYNIYLWDVLTHDYNASYPPERMMTLIKRYTRNGSIINFHDSVKSNERMLATLPQAIEFLLSEGYTLLPL